MNPVPIDLARDELMTLAEAARLLKVSPATAYRWTLKGRLRAWRREGRLVTTRAACEAMLVPVETGQRPAFGQAERPRQPQARHSKRTEQILREAGML